MAVAKRVRVSVNGDKAKNIIAALKLLDTYEESVGGRIIRLPYKLGAVRLIAARNLNALNDIANTYDKELEELIKRHANGQPTIGPDHENWKSFKEEFDEFAEHEEEVTLLQMKEEDLNIENNNISLTALGVLYLHNLIKGSLIQEEAEDSKPEASS